MCDTYVDTIGYVCTDCQEQFKQAMAKECTEDITEYDITASLEAWLQIEKEEEGDLAMYKQIDSYFNDYKQSRF